MKFYAATASEEVHQFNSAKARIEWMAANQDAFTLTAKQAEEVLGWNKRSGFNGRNPSGVPLIAHA